MNVLLIGNSAADRQLSMLGFAGALLSGLCERGVSARLIAPRQMFGRFGQPHAGVGKWLAYVDKHGLFPRDLRKALAWADVVHVCDQGNAMYMKHLQQIPHVLTCHDLLAMRAAHGEMPGWTVSRTGRVYQDMILNGINQAQHIACVSETTRQELLRLSRIPEIQTSVVMNGMFSAYHPMPPDDSAPILDAFGLDAARPYLLHVGGNQPYKNRPGVLAIYAALRRLTPETSLQLVMAGKPFSAEMRRAVIDHALTGHVVELIRPTNQQLRALYSRATALVFASLDEGFGLPIIEAQACGCPVFTSDQAPLTEVGGDAAHYLDPTRPEQAAHIITAHLEDAETMRAAGFLNVQRFTTERMIDGYLNIYEHVLRRGGARCVSSTS